MTPDPQDPITEADVDVLRWYVTNRGLLRREHYDELAALADKLDRLCAPAEPRSLHVREGNCTQDATVKSELERLEGFVSTLTGVERQVVGATILAYRFALVEMGKADEWWTDALSELEAEVRWLRAQPAEPPEGAAHRGAEMIGAERQRQLDAEGWTVEHDREHLSGRLAAAALSYAEAGAEQLAAIQYKGGNVPAEDLFTRTDWPWSSDWWKPSDDPVRNLVKAGALIAAEIDRTIGPAAPVATPVPEPEPTCDGRCLMADDVGVYGYSGVVAVKDPECSLHGDRGVAPVPEDTTAPSPETET